jgi:hypothetical protein
MHIVIVGGGTAGWLAGMMISSRHPNHNVTVIESSKIGVIGVGESTTGLLTDILNNHIWDFGCDHNEFIIETGASLKYAIKHKGWTPDIDDYYIGPIDGSFTREHGPDILFAYGMKHLPKKDLIKVSQTGSWIHKGMTDFNKHTHSFNNMTHAMHVDAHLVGQYFKKVTLRKPNTKHIDAKVVDALLNEKGSIKEIVLEDGTKIAGDFFIDCTGFARLLISKMPGNEWISYQDHLPVNAAIPFHLEYEEDELPEPYTTAWAQDNGWMWQIPLMDRKGCGYVFSDEFTTPDQAHDEIEKRLGKKINAQQPLKFTTGRQKTHWINNCLSIGLSTAFVEPLEATSIHSTVVMIKNFAFDYLQNTLEGTLNTGSIRRYNDRAKNMFDDFKDFLVMHYMGGRTDTEFWRYINSGVTRTEYVDELLEMSKHRMLNQHDFKKYYGSAGWPLYSYVIEGINKFGPNVAKDALSLEVPGFNNDFEAAVENDYIKKQQDWHYELQDCYSWAEFVQLFRQIRRERGLSNI